MAGWVASIGGCGSVPGWLCGDSWMRVTMPSSYSLPVQPLEMAVVAARIQYAR